MNLFAFTFLSLSLTHKHKVCAKTSKFVRIALCPRRDQPASHLVGIFFKSHSGIRGQTSRLLPSNWCLHWNHPSKPPTRTIQLSMKSATNRFDYIRVVGLAMVCAADGSINGAIRYFTPRLFVKMYWGRSKLMFVYGWVDGVPCNDFLCPTTLCTWTRK